MVTTELERIAAVLSDRTPQRSGFPNGRSSAVLLPFSVRDGQESLLLARRSREIDSHPGQICFPGGKPEPEDATLFHTALREANEELGIEPDHVTLLGELDEVFTITGFNITPFVVALPSHLDPSPQTDELDAMFWVPVQDLLLPSNYTNQPMKVIGGKTYDMKVFHVTDPPVWGATARILRQLLTLVYGWDDPYPNDP